MRYFFLYLLFAVPSYLPGQNPGPTSGSELLGKLDLILEMQDRRTLNDGKLLSFFSDPDPIVRERAVLAYGSIQDTNVIPLMIDRLTGDTDQNVSLAASFAIGQTAGLLSAEAKRELEHDLVWARMDQLRGAVRERLIIDIGKFGTVQALDDLILRYGADMIAVKPEVLARSIGRFAIRNVTSSGAIRYLLQFLKSDPPVQREVAYGLQRTGSNKIITDNLEEIAQLWRSPDPGVRMNLATLLGRVKDPAVSIGPLEEMFFNDSDWRVRVNAVKSLCNYRLTGHPEILRKILWTFDSQEMNIAVAALNAFGNTPVEYDWRDPRIQPLFRRLEEIAVNEGGKFRWQLQGEAANALAKVGNKEVIRFISAGEETPVLLRSQMFIALGTAGTPEDAPMLESAIKEDNPVLARAAIEGLSALARRYPADTGLTDRTIRQAVRSLGFDDPSVVTTAAEILGDSLFLRSASVEPLMAALANCTAPDDLEAVQAIIASLGRLKDGRSVKVLEKQLRSRDLTCARAAASALRKVTGHDYSSAIPSYIEPLFVDYDTAYLHSLPDTVPVVLETIRGTIKLELYKNRAPFTVMSFLKLASQRGFYRGLSFHRIVPNFVVQGGDPRGDGWGGPGYSIRSEFAPISFETGSLGMASSGKDTEGSQFFITESPQPHLDGRYTNFGKVVSGIDVVYRLELDDRIIDVKISE